MAMFGVFKNLYVWMIRPKMTGGTGARMTGLCYVKSMSGMAGSAITHRAVRIYGSHACIRPGAGIGAVVIIQLDSGTVTLHTSGFLGCAAVFGMALPFVKKHKLLHIVLSLNLKPGTKMSTVAEIFYFFRVTSFTGGRAYKR
jgi:hypothetical protein